MVDALAAFAATHENQKTKTCTTNNVGSYEAKRDSHDKDGFVIYTRDGKLEYRLTGTSQEPVAASEPESPSRWLGLVRMSR